MSDMLNVNLILGFMDDFLESEMRGENLMHSNTALYKEHLNDLKIYAKGRVDVLLEMRDALVSFVNKLEEEE